MIITGNVGKDPELRTDTTGNQFATFSMGVSVGTKQAPKTDWVEVSVNGKLADIARMYIKKGSKILVEGFPTATAYINRENKPVASLRIYANNIELLSKRENEEVHADAGHHEPVYSLPPEQEEPQYSSMPGALTSSQIPF